MPPAMKRLLADLQLPANRFDRRALVEVHLRLAQLRNDLLRRVSLPFHRVLPPSRAVRLSYQLVHLEGVRSWRPRQLSWSNNSILAWLNAVLVAIHAALFQSITKYCCPL